MQKINLRELYPDVYKTNVFVDVAEEVVAAIRGQEQDDAAYERRKFRHKAHYSLNREDGIENDALNRPLTPEEVLEQGSGEHVVGVELACVGKAVCGYFHRGFSSFSHAFCCTQYSTFPGGGQQKGAAA